MFIGEGRVQRPHRYPVQNALFGDSVAAAQFTPFLEKMTKAPSCSESDSSTSSSDSDSGSESSSHEDARGERQEKRSKEKREEGKQEEAS